MRSRAWIAMLALTVAAACTREVVPATPEAPMPAPVPAAAERAPEWREAVTRVAEKAERGVVQIRTARVLGVDEDSLWSAHHFGLARRVDNVGSGIVYRADGVILTNDHVVRGAGRILVTLPGGQTMEAHVIGSDRLTDLALLKVDASGLEVLRLAADAKPAVGEWVVTVGSPFGLAGSVSAGVVSAIGRKDMGLQRYERFIQTDAAINQGNSGGPLLDLEGRVIGINTAIMAGANGVGFAIPADMAGEIAEALLKDGSVGRGYLGVRIQDPTTTCSAYLRRVPRAEGGVLVNRVFEDGAAHAGGVREMDVMLDFDAAALRNSTHLQNVVAEAPPGTEHRITLWRDGREIVVPVSLKPFPNDDESDSIIVKRETDRIGAMVRETKRTNRDTAVTEPAVAVDHVAIGSPADLAGLAAGDVIVDIEDRKITSRAVYDQMLRSLPKGGLALMLVDRAGAEVHLAVALPGLKRRLHGR
ncbi:MAG: trypsin-like peptidase domain-containing protein [Deltaproteobacteria bacterium]|nr:trypsin-like peptidase domain-containing protein [Deltaproteobacteria bacterium]